MVASAHTSMNARAGRLLAASVAFAALVALAGPAMAQPSPRAADHDGYGRMVFEWPGAVTFSAVVADGALVVKFNKPIAGDPKVVVKPLARYLAGVKLSPDRTTATFALARPVKVKSFRDGGKVVIDVSEDNTPPTPKTAPAAPAAAPAATAPATLPVAATATVAPPQPATAGPAPAGIPAGPPTDLMVRGGEHTGFNRLVFDWPKPVGYTVEEDGGDRVIVSFARPARINPTALKSALPADVGLVEVRPSGTGTAVVLSLAPGMRARHFTSGPKVAIDLVRPADAPPPPRAEGVPPPPLAPAPGGEQPPSLPPSAPPQAAPALPPVTVPPAPAPTPSERVVSLGFAFDKPTGAAVFRRGPWLWAVFDAKTELDTKLLKRTGGDLVAEVEQVQGVKGTAVRILLQPGYNPSVRKEGQLWVLDIHRQPLQPRLPAEVTPRLDFQDRGRLVIAAADGLPAQMLRDPEVGDVIQVVPLTEVGRGVRDGRVLPGATLLPSAQGVAALPVADGARLDVAKAQIDLTAPGGLYLSPAPAGGPAVAETPAAAPAAGEGGPLDISTWMRGGPDKFAEEHDALLHDLAQQRPDERNRQRLEIARHYLANGFAPEALGELRLIAASDPGMAESPDLRAVRGAANFLAHHDEEAIADLSLPALKDDPRVQLFLAAATARARPNPEQQALTLRLAPDEIKGWAPPLRMALGDVAVRTVAGAGDGKGAARVLDAMMGPGLSNREVAHLSYLGGLASIASKQYDQAINRFNEAEAGPSRPDRAYAVRDRVELQLRLGKITPDQAISELEKMRFAWRGEDFEFQLLKRLGELQLDAKRYGEGLRTLRQLTVNYSGHNNIPAVLADMSNAFSRLFLAGEADKLPPVTAIGLYDEFQELTPSGPAGDEMIRRLADRLASVDLLDRASDLLRHQVEQRLTGLDKARIGSRLAFLNISNRKPAQALEALDLSEVPGIPADLAAQRRYLRVQALDDLGRSAEALALIINDQSEEAGRLRGEINWRLKKWPEAAAALESALEKPLGNRPLDPAMSHRVLDTATAMTLAHDERGLARLRRNFGPLMEKTEQAGAFNLLTSEPERGIADYRRIGDKIKQAEEFQTFMGEWKKRVKDRGLSSMN
ncbi:tetratricopeptide repeat protein [Phaeospirillum tilakii]|uniref:Tetratricopeptide repeat protein n=1 Tax=Phaeospirillum tilakii TaxID=741673 RepID=A0ABW5CCE6_9PROT